MTQLILVRGVPGSGKSTLVRNMRNESFDVSLEADNYFLRRDGVYDFNPRLLKNAHDACFQDCEEYVRGGVRIAWVANTFTRIWEMQRYIDLAKECDAELVVYRCTGNYQNVHGVPADKVLAMAARMENLEGEILV